MAKRFTDTEKWKKPWFRKLGSEGRDIWQWCHDNCDHVGVLELDLERISFDLGYPVTIEKIEKVFGDKIVKIDNRRFWLAKFMRFQFGEMSGKSKLNRNMMKKIIKLTANLPLSGKNKHLIESYQRVISQWGEGDVRVTPPPSNSNSNNKSNNKSNKGGVGEKETPVSKSDLETAYHNYPLKKGKQKGLEKAKVQIKTADDLEALKTAIEKYKADLGKNNTDPKFIKHFSTFMGEWRDWLDPSTGSSTVQVKRRKTIEEIIAEEEALDVAK